MDTIKKFSNAYASYNSIFQNYYQYNDFQKKQCIKIADSYFTDYIKICEIKEINIVIEEIKNWLNKTSELLYN